MAKDNQFPHKALADWIPKSQRDSGVNLDEGCGNAIEQAEAGRGLDHAVKLIDGKRRAKDETNFTSASTAHGNNENGPVGLPLMSSEGKSLADVTAPGDASVVHTKSTAAVKEG
jgi:hypothetical protein